MAVNTRQRRFSMMSLGWGTRNLTPDGTIAQEDRQHLLWGYSGIAWDVPSDVTPIEILTFLSYITTKESFLSQITTTEDFKSDIETKHEFLSGVH